MTKQEFIAALRAKLSGLPKQEVEERLDFYSEMIADRMEEGHTEEEAVAAIGSVEGVAAQIVADIPFRKIAKERMNPKRRLKAWEIVLLAVGSPIWLSLAIAAFAVILSVYAVLWAVDVSLWSVFASIAACAVGGTVAGAVFLFGGNVPAGFAVIGTAIFCAGFAILLFFGCKAATKGIVRLTAKIAVWIKKCFARREEA